MTRKGFRNFVYVVLLCLASFCTQAKFTSVRIGINGLTCSQCSRSVEMQLRKLNFVSTVTMDLANTQGVILFKNDTKVDISAIAQAVKNAGFSLRYLNADVEVNDVQFSDSRACFTYKNDAYQLIEPISKNEAQLILVFLGKDYNAEKSSVKPKGVSLICKGAKTYHVVSVK